MNCCAEGEYRAMLQLKPLSPDEAPEASRPQLRAVSGRLGFVPVQQALLAHAPAALKAYASMSALLGESSLTLVERGVIFITASRSNRCGYCVAAHSAGAGLDEDVLAALRAGRRIDGEPRLDALRVFVGQIVEQRGFLKPRQLEDFLAAGFEEPQVLEVITAIAMKTLSNYTNHLMQTPLDEFFQPYAWSETAESALP